MGWDSVVKQVSKFVVRIETPDGSGSGFLCLYNFDHSWIGIATAAHVVARADEWQQPIRVLCEATQRSKLLTTSDRVIFIDHATDSAVIFLPNDLCFQEDVIPLLSRSTYFPVGTPIGWLGYPGIARNTMCFFTGTISAVGHFGTQDYLIDGVAVNGVSGGPVFYHTDTDGAFIIGTLSAYMPNRQPSGSLPGLSVAQDVSHFHDVLRTVKSWDEANQKKREMQEEEEESSGS